MRFLFLLLPNLYDIFTLMMIGYAFMLHQKGELQVQFGLACGLIYAATRLGIFAGKILHSILGKPQTDEMGEQEAGGRRFIFDFGPQVICVIAFQVIMMITSLPHSTVPAGDKIASETKQPVQVEQKKEDMISSESSSAITEAEQKKREYDELFSETDEDVVTTQAAKPTQATAEAKPAVKTSYTAPRKVYAPKDDSASAKVTVAEVNVQPVPAAPVVQKRPVYIPERTLNVAGVSAAEIRINNAQRNVITAASANAVSQNTVISAATNVNPNTSSLSTKRYPGDDNPIPTAWGYYKQLQQEQAAKQPQQNNVQQPQQNRTTIPANTLRTIGY